MSGYFGYSMSTNAVDAYENGEKPLSKWTKRDILSCLDMEAMSLNCNEDNLRSAPAAVLKDLCLSYSSWHHTGSFYNQTEFYIFDATKVEQLTDEELDYAIQTYADQKAKPTSSQKWECAFLEWSGSKKHPKATEVVEVGIVKGEWFIRSDGTKKKTSARGFRFIKQIQEEGKE